MKSLRAAVFCFEIVAIAALCLTSCDKHEYPQVKQPGYYTTHEEVGFKGAKIIVHDWHPMKLVGSDTWTTPDRPTPVPTIKD